MSYSTDTPSHAVVHCQRKEAQTITITTAACDCPSRIVLPCCSTLTFRPQIVDTNEYERQCYQLGRILSDGSGFGTIPLRLRDTLWHIIARHSSW